MTLKKICNHVFIAFVLLTSTQLSYAACGFIYRDRYDAIDAALPCTNFRNLHLQGTGETMGAGQAEMREALQHGIYGELVGVNLNEPCW